jgi:tetratricopeptide (TPR) repeat protein
MGYWGEALVLGPNINAPMAAENVPKAWDALQQALKHLNHETPRHRDYILALAERYAEAPPDDRSALDQAYAEAMRGLAAKYPDDYDAQALLAESLMDTTPWDYWQKNGEPKEITRDLLRTLERVLARRPNHPLANHLYIHAVEKEHPQWGEACADRLRDLVPGAGHLVHMPAHIYIRVARYEDANAANERAIDADQAYIAQCHAQGLYMLGYVPHNHHFLWFGKAMTGESQDCLAAARHVREHVDKEKMREPGLGTLQHFYTLPMWTYIRFCMWDEALGEEKPAADLTYPTAVWHFARGMALARTGQAQLAQAELDELNKFAADKSLKDVTIWEINTTYDLLQIAEQVLAAAVAEAEGDLLTAEARLRRAVELEDALNYDEPPTWFIPPRQLLGAVLLADDKPAEAENTYREELRIYPGNGWSLLGLHQAFKAQGKTEAADEAKRRFDEAWSNADVMLGSSRRVRMNSVTLTR